MLKNSSQEVGVGFRHVGKVVNVRVKRTSAALGLPSVQHNPIFTDLSYIAAEEWETYQPIRLFIGWLLVWRSIKARSDLARYCHMICIYLLLNIPRSAAADVSPRAANEGDGRDNDPPPCLAAFFVFISFNYRDQRSANTQTATSLAAEMLFLIIVILPRHDWT